MFRTVGHFPQKIAGRVTDTLISTIVIESKICIKAQNVEVKNSSSVIHLRT